MKFFQKKKEIKKEPLVYLKHFTVKQVLERFERGVIKIKNSESIVNEEDIENFVNNKLRFPYIYCACENNTLIVISDSNFIIQLIELSKKNFYNEIFNYLVIDFIVIECVPSEKLIDIF